MYQFAKIHRDSQQGHQQRQQHVVVMLPQQGRVMLGHRAERNVPHNLMGDTQLHGSHAVAGLPDPGKH